MIFFIRLEDFWSDDHQTSKVEVSYSKEIEDCVKKKNQVNCFSAMELYMWDIEEDISKRILSTMMKFIWRKKNILL